VDDVIYGLFADQVDGGQDGAIPLETNALHHRIQHFIDESENIFL
jgi:hypothetical protein